MTEKKTDIDRLHAVIEGRFCGRGCGKTYAMCQKVAGFVEVGQKEILCVVPFFQWLRWLRDMMIGVLKEHGLGVQVFSPDVLLCNGSIIRFVRDRPRDLVARSGLAVDFNDLADPLDVEYFRRKVILGLGVPEEFLEHEDARADYVLHLFERIWPKRLWPR